MTVIWTREYDCCTTSDSEHVSTSQWHRPSMKAWNGTVWCLYCGAVIHKVHRSSDSRTSDVELPWWWVRHLTIQEWP